MKNIAVVSVDMFQTLVNVNSRCDRFWERLFPQKIPRYAAGEYWSQATKLIFGNYDELFRQGKTFVNSRAIMETSFSQLARQTGLNIQPKEAARILTEEHGLSSPYEDTGGFLNAVGKHFPICVVSDADDDMIRPLMNMYRFDKLFTSEQFQSYKGSPEGRIFQAVVDHYGVEPGRILHIGDSKNDVFGAKRAGLQACWLNRKARQWQDEILPDYTVTSLSEVVSLLGVGSR